MTPPVDATGSRPCRSLLGGSLLAPQRFADAKPHQLSGYAELAADALPPPDP